MEKFNKCRCKKGIAASKAPDLCLAGIAGVICLVVGVEGVFAKDAALAVGLRAAEGAEEGAQFRGVRTPTAQTVEKLAIANVLPALRGPREKVSICA